MYPRQRRRLRLLSLVMAVPTALSIAACGTSSTSTSAPFYQGKTIKMIVPFAPGGGTDIAARLMANYLHQLVAGSPKVQVVNLPGAGGLTGANEWFQKYPPDGTSVLFTSGSQNFPLILGDTAVKFDYSKMVPILGLPDGRVTGVASSAVGSSPTDLLHPSKQLKMGLQDGTGLDAIDLLGMSLLNIPIKPILGYGGGGPRLKAFDAGEINVVGTSRSDYLGTLKPLVSSKKADAIYQVGIINSSGKNVRDPAIPSVPTLAQEYQAIHGKALTGPGLQAYEGLVPATTTAQKIFWLQGNAPKAAISALDAAAKKISTDKSFIAKAPPVLGSSDVVIGSELTQAVKVMDSVAPSSKQYVLHLLETKYKINPNG